MSWTKCLEHIATDDEGAEIRDRIVGLFEYANGFAEQCEADTRPVVVLVSRRLACLYELARDSGMAPFAGSDVVIDRVLEMSDDDWSGRPILLLDDVAVGGTTICGRFVDLQVGRKALASDIEVRIAVVDEERINNSVVAGLNLADPSGPVPFFAKSKRVDELAKQIVQCLYQAGIPYFTDFPIAEEIPVSQAALDSILGSEEWHVFDTTAHLIAGLNQRAFSLLPTESLSARTLGRTSASAASTSTLQKIRIFVRPGIDNELLLRVVPISVPGGLTDSELQEVLDEVTRDISGGTKPFIDRNDWLPKGRHRLLQMYLSSCLLAEFWELLERLDVVAEKLDSSKLSRSHLETYFGSAQLANVERAFDASVVQYSKVDISSALVEKRWMADPESELWKSEEAARLKAARSLAWIGRVNGEAEIGRLGPPKCPADFAHSQAEMLNPLWVSEVLNLFGLVGTALEDKQRSEMKELPFDEMLQLAGDVRSDGPNTKELIHTKGIGITELAAFFAFEYIDNLSWARTALSLAIDVGNDLGIAVPITRCVKSHRCGRDQNCGPVVRQYRSGEGSQLASKPLSSLSAEELENEIFDQTDEVTKSAVAGLFPDRMRADGEGLLDLETLKSRVRPANRDLVGASIEHSYFCTVDYLDGTGVSALIEDQLQHRHSPVESKFFGLAELEGFGLTPEDFDDGMSFNLTVVIPAGKTQPLCLVRIPFASF